MCEQSSCVSLSLAAQALHTLGAAQEMQNIVTSLHIPQQMLHTHTRTQNEKAKQT